MSINCVRCRMPAEFVYLGSSYCRPHYEARREQVEQALRNGEALMNILDEIDALMAEDARVEEEEHKKASKKTKAGRK